MNRYEILGLGALRLGAEAAEASLNLYKSATEGKSLGTVGTAAIKAGEQVEVAAAGIGKVAGQLLNYAKTEGGHLFGIVRLPEGQQLAPRAPIGDVSFVHPRLFRDKAGFLFNTTEDFAKDDMPRVADLKFLQTTIAPEAGTMKLPNGQVVAAHPDSKEIAASGKFISENAGDRAKFLSAIANAPEYRFGGSPLIRDAKSVFNPNGATINCMACTGSLIRTMSTGKLTTANDIARLRFSGDLLGHPTVGKFEDMTSAMDWLGKASGGTVKTASTPIRSLTPDRPYAVNLKLGGADSNVWHSAFAYKPEGAKPFLYDAQSGVRWHPDSPGLKKTTVSVHEVQVSANPQYK